MCGDSSRRSEGGALAVLSQSQDSIRYAQRPRLPMVAGRIVFRDSIQGSSMVTQAELTMDDALCNLTEEATFMVGIHETGDLTTSAIISPFMFKFDMARVSARSRGPSSGFMEAELSRPLVVGVGGDGIIGRRVTIWAPDAAFPIAEGIVGYN